MSYRPPLLASIPLLPAAVFVAAGIMLAVLFPGLKLYGAAIMVALVVCALLLKRTFIAICAAFTAIGLMTAVLHSPTVANLSGVKCNYSGIAIDVDCYSFSQRIVVKLCGSDNGAEVLLRVHSSMPVTEPGDTVRFTSVLRPVSGSDSEIPDVNLPLRGSEWYRISAIADITPESLTGNSDNFGVYPPHSLGISYRLERMRMRFADMIYDSGLSPSAAAFLTAVLTGDTSYLSVDTRKAFSQAGSAHMLALSGMHVAVIAFLVSLFFFPLRLMGRNNLAMALTIVMLWFYAFLTGLSPSVVRAVIMASVILIGRLAHRSNSSLNSLCLAAILILIFDPWQMFAVGFQLSFAAVAAILMFAFDIVPPVRMWGIIRRMLQWIAVSFSAVIGTGALVAYYFHQVPLLFIVANIPASLLLPFLMGGELFNILLDAAGCHSGMLASAISCMYGWLEAISIAIARTEWTSVQNVYFSPWLLLPYYMGVVSAWIAIKRRLRVWFVASGMLFLFFSGAFAITCSPTHRPEAYVVEYPYSTVIVAYDGDSCSILTDAPDSQFDKIVNLMQIRLNDFARRRRGVIAAVNPVIKSKRIYADSTLWCFGDLTIAPVRLRKNLHPVALRPDYALISARYFGTMRQVVDSLQPDTVVIAHTLPIERQTKFIRQLDSIGTPYRIGLPVRLL